MPGAATYNCDLPVGNEALVDVSPLPVGTVPDVVLELVRVGDLALLFVFEALAFGLASVAAGLVPLAFALALAHLRAALDNNGPIASIFFNCSSVRSSGALALMI